MKAAIYTHYGSADVLKLKEVEKPSPGDNEVLIKVHATTVAPVDIHFRSGTPLLARKMAGGFLKPKIIILGFDLAGVIESVGNNVEQFKQGDRVYGFVPTGMNGTCAEYISVPEDYIIKKPDNLTFEEAATVPASAAQSLLFLQAGNIQNGKIKPIIDRRYPLEQSAEAHRYIEKGHSKGKVVISII